MLLHSMFDLAELVQRNPVFVSDRIADVVITRSSWRLVETLRLRAPAGYQNL
jgi:hypothetical protein